MAFSSLSEFLAALDRKKLLRKISDEVNPELEANRIVHDIYREFRGRLDQVPAVLFENVKGSKFPLAINVLGSDRGIDLLLGKTPEQVGAHIGDAIQSLQHAAAKGEVMSWAWHQKEFLMAARHTKPNHVRNAPCQEVKKFGADVNLLEFPILKCWPGDGGRFITSGLIITKSPKTGARNMGVYRLQVHNEKELGLHWQIQKGGGFHYHEAEELNQPLEVSIVIGADPLLWLAGVFPLPEGLDEIAVAGFLRKESVPMIRCATNSLMVPASAEIVIEGVARPGRRQTEGPFGDHFGHYSHASPFPVLEVQAITHRKNAIYQAAVVGKPPQEDKAMGETISKIFLPLVKLTKPELVDMWAYFETGFHNLLVASAKQRYEKEAVKTALGLLGEGQLSLSKIVILVDPDVNVRDFSAVLRALRANFTPEHDFLLLPGVSQDTLDFTGPRLNFGSKMILDATRTPKASTSSSSSATTPVSTTPVQNSANAPNLSTIDSNILEARAMEGTMLVVKVKQNGRDILKKLLQRQELAGYKMIAVVSDDVPLNDDILILWGVFTRFDCERDIIFKEVKLEGSRAVHSGPMGIDATWKESYPKPVEF